MEETKSYYKTILQLPSCPLRSADTSPPGRSACPDPLRGVRSTFPSWLKAEAGACSSYTLHSETHSAAGAGTRSPRACFAGRAVLMDGSKKWEWEEKKMMTII